MRALDAWWFADDAPTVKLSRQFSQQIPTAHQRGLNYLAKQQLEDGSWLALWFGNQDHSGEDNPIYGTSRVLLALNEVRAIRDEPKCVKIRENGVQFLLSSQNRDGGWGGGKSVPYRVKLDGSEEKEGSSIEETAVALEALLSLPDATLGKEATIRGLNWLSKAISLGYHRTSWPIGFYFAKLWYHEKLYPLIFSLAAVGLALQTKTDNQE
jgi:squalene-hopene/tetraprenyl-beta-curcumene cyclase